MPRSQLRYLPLLFFPALALTQTPAPPPPPPDQVVLVNGDTITGEIVKKEDGKLTIKSEFLGEVTMPWKAVKSIRSTQPLTVVMPNGQMVLGTLATSGNTLEVATPSGPQTAPLADIDALRNAAQQQAWERMQHPKITQLWSGYYDVGLALARGNAYTDTLTNAANATRTTLNDKINVYFSQIYSNARLSGITAATASAIIGGWTYNRNLTPRFFLSTLNEYDHDRFQDLNLRFVAGGGVGVNAVKNNTTNLALTVGGDYEREGFEQNLVRNSGEANFGDDLSYKLSGLTTVTQSFQFFPNLTYTGQYRFTFNFGTVTTLRKWLGWHITVTDLFLSNPVFGLQRNDFILSTGLRATFSR